MNIIKFCFVVLTIAAFITACNQNQALNNAVVKSNTVNAATPAPASTPVDDLAAGRKLYSDNCAICHKDTGVGGEITIEGKAIDPANLTGDKMKKRSDEKLFKDISEGVTDEGMPAFKGKLTDDQIREVVKYVRNELQKM